MDTKRERMDGKPEREPKRRRGFRGAAVLAAALGLSLLLAACTEKEKESTGGNSETAGLSGTQSVSAVETAVQTASTAVPSQSTAPESEPATAGTEKNRETTSAAGHSDEPDRDATSEDLPAAAHYDTPEEIEYVLPESPEDLSENNP